MPNYPNSPGLKVAQVLHCVARKVVVRERFHVVMLLQPPLASLTAIPLRTAAPRRVILRRVFLSSTLHNQSRCRYPKIASSLCCVDLPPSLHLFSRRLCNYVNSL